MSEGWLEGDLTVPLGTGKGAGEEEVTVTSVSLPGAEGLECQSRQPAPEGV